MTYKVIDFPKGVTTETAETMLDLVSSIDTDPFMVVAIEHIDDPEEPYQAINFKKLGKVQLNYSTGPQFVEAESILEALGGDTPTGEYVLLTSQPDDWATNYATYFTKEGDNYLAVQGVEVTTYSPEFEQNKYYKLEDTTYVLLDAEPEDWGTGTYYTSDDGAEPVYTEVTFTSSTETVAPEFAENTYYEYVEE